ncbi:hypothetical protein [Candidatus Nitrosotenuis uzonensis]|uniref:Uncharacterized protein n=1 Tax=Candidatus Nitrosotenuis uzonensis TaxID=1407055 RepID=A0A812F0J8_9ARCH|nr:hypothetical protein [Candidatus Nitrosotenuis uzonensis]CAE6485945.1 conserved hypothetical protein [Candidatus Nitrosotenuis uzonensis]
MKITRILPKSLAKVYQEWDLNKAEAYLEYHESMARVFRQRVEQGREELRRLEGGWNC